MYAVQEIHTARGDWGYLAWPLPPSQGRKGHPVEYATDVRFIAPERLTGELGRYYHLGRIRVTQKSFNDCRRGRE